MGWFELVENNKIYFRMVTTIGGINFIPIFSIVKLQYRNSYLHQLNTTISENPKHFRNKTKRLK